MPLTPSILSKSCIREESLKDFIFYDKTRLTRPTGDVTNHIPCELPTPRPNSSLEKHIVEEVRDENSQPARPINKSFYGIEITNQCQETGGLAAYIKRNEFLNSFNLDAASISSAFSSLNNFSVLPEKINTANCSKHSEVSTKEKFMDTLKESNRPRPMSTIVDEFDNKDEYDNHVDNFKDWNKKNIAETDELKITACSKDLVEKSTLSNIVNSDQTNLISLDEVIDRKEEWSKLTELIDYCNENLLVADISKNITQSSNSHLFVTSKDVEDSEDEITYILLSSDDSDFDDTAEVMRESFKTMSFLEYEVLNKSDKNMIEDSFKKSLHFSKDEIELSIKSSTPMKGRNNFNYSDDTFCNGATDSVITFTNSYHPLPSNPQVGEISSTLCVQNKHDFSNDINLLVNSGSGTVTEDIILSENQIEEQYENKILSANDKIVDSVPQSNVHSHLENNYQLNCTSKDVNLPVLIFESSNEAKSYNVNLEINDAELKEEKSNKALCNAELNVSFHSLSLENAFVNYSPNERLCDQSSDLKSENIPEDILSVSIPQNIKEAQEHKGTKSNDLCINNLNQSPGSHIGLSSVKYMLDPKEIQNSNDDVISLLDSYCSLFNEELSTSEALFENKNKSEIADNAPVQLCHEPSHSIPALKAICHKEKVSAVGKISTSLFEKDSLLEANEGNKKSYQKSFVSNNDKENKDNNDPEWEFLKKLRSDEERYYIVRRQWKNLLVPDPNVNLTQYSFRWKHNLKTHSEGSGSIIPKRKRDSEDDSLLLPSSKRRKFNNIGFNDSAISKTEKMLYQDFVIKLKDPQLNRNGIRQVEERYLEYKRQFNFAKEEAKAMFNFYQGLPNQGIIEQGKIEKEQSEIDILYHLFERYYNWNGTVFNPVIKSRGFIRYGRCRR